MYSQMKDSYYDFSCSVFFTIAIFLPAATAAVDIITTTTPLKDGEILISSGGEFELGFFSTDNNSHNRYLGIWYGDKSPRTVVWVANRASPINASSGVLSLSSQGILTLLQHLKGPIIWSATPKSSQWNPIAQLLDVGNLVVKEHNNDINFAWESFDYPTDTLLPGMKLGFHLETRLERFLTSWKATQDPSPGDYTFKVDTSGYPQLLLRRGSVKLFRNGPWNGLRFSGAPQLRENPIYDFQFVYNDTDIYYSYSLKQASVVSRMVLNPSGILQRFTWIDRTKSWVLYLSAQMDDCDDYDACGAYGLCNVGQSPFCGCLEGFVPKYPEEWRKTDWTNGCVRNTALNCGNGDGFKMYSGIKLPDTRKSWFDKEMSLENCRARCLTNCSCMAYTRLNISGDGSGCLLWFEDIIDVRILIENGQDIYIRMASSEIGNVASHKKRLAAIIAILVSGIVLLALGLLLWLCRRKKIIRQVNEQLDIPSFDYETISKATNHFSSRNKLGQGGFGSVYKGKLNGYQEIAVKVLSDDSRQGIEEFKNEVRLIAKLQHRNLVKLLGCGVQKQKMLIYEYMSNKSLNHFIFDEVLCLQLNWQKRFNIINGISRGLLYLHHDSRLRIIHRDLKASNILLDEEMNPKISDFGLAKVFWGNETGASTARVVGTHGYMSPEYAIDGLFSMKSDIFGFGVLVLEIVSGKRNRGFSHPDHHLNLLGHAWKLHQENRAGELMNSSFSCDLHQVIRTIHVALLCVQFLPEDRPSMPSVVLMLGGEGSLPQPKQPGFYMERNPLEAIYPSPSKDSSHSTNEMSVTFLGGR